MDSWRALDDVLGPARGLLGTYSGDPGRNSTTHLGQVQIDLWLGALGRLVGLLGSPLGPGGPQACFLVIVSYRIWPFVKQSHMETFLRIQRKQFTAVVPVSGAR